MNVLNTHLTKKNTFNIMRRNLILGFVFASFSLCLTAQGKFDLHVGGSFATGDFKSNDSETGGAASTGLEIGLKYLFPLSACDGLSLTGGIDWHYNGVNQIVKDELRLLATASGYTNLSVDYFSYINVPVLVGLNYELPINKTLGVFGDAGMGFNYSKVTDLTMRFSYEGINAKTLESFDPKFKMAFQVGGGLSILKQYTIGLHYNMLGSYDYNGKITNSAGGQSQTIDNPSATKVKVNILNLTVGIRY